MPIKPLFTFLQESFFPMKPIHFRGKNYDAPMVARLAGQGHREDVKTSDIVTIAAQAGYDVLVAIKIEDKYHLLTGKIDPKKQYEQLHILSTVQLKKAVVEPTTYGERQHDVRERQHQARTTGFNDYGNWRGGR